MASQQPERYNIPTHLNVPDKVVFSLLGFKIGLTLRQLGILVAGGICGYQLFKNNVSNPIDVLYHILLPVSIFILTPIFAFYRYAERNVEDWLLAIYFFLQQPRVYTWHKLSIQERTIEEHEEKTE